MKPPTFSDEVRVAMWTLQGCKCFLCDETKNLTAHHIIENGKTNRKIYLDKVQDIRNGRYVCSVHHNNTSWDRKLKKDLHKIFKAELQTKGKWKGKLP